MTKVAKRKLRPAEGWPEGWYYSGEVDTVNLEAMLDPDGFFNRLILEKPMEDRHTWIGPDGYRYSGAKAAAEIEREDRQAIEAARILWAVALSKKRNGGGSMWSALLDELATIWDQADLEVKPRPEAAEVRQPDLCEALPQESTASKTELGSPAAVLPRREA